MSHARIAFLALAATLVAGCTSSGDDTSAGPAGAGGAAAGGAPTAGTGGASGGGGATTAGASGDQLPPKGKAAIEAWLASGAYLSWHCEPEPHAPAKTSAHSGNRICSNDLTVAWAGAGERPKGSASVKELYDTTLTKVVGHAVSIKDADASGSGTGWYWYERSGSSVYADGLGVSLCVGCHADAGKTSTGPHSGDYVYTVAP